MALIKIQLSSSELISTKEVTVIYPDQLFNNKDNVNILYLLHGYSGSNNDWVRYTNIEKLVSNKNMIVVMMDGANSFYTNMKYGGNYFNYLTKELPEKIENIFNIKHEKENTHIAGLSMGGYGALKAALTYPNKYGSVFSFSGALNIKTIFSRLEGRKSQIEAVFGSEDDLNNDLHIHDLFELTNNLKNNNLNIYFSCGTEDFLYDDNLKFKKHLEQENISFDYYETKGDHNWTFWSNEIERVIKLYFNEEK